MTELESSWSTVELYRNDMKFSSAHFTIFSATNRERLHGHNYQVKTQVCAKMNEHGITYDYSITRKQVLALCRSLNEYMLLPEYSPHLTISKQDEFYKVIFDGQAMYFLQAETRLLPIKNTTSECLAQWFVDQLTADVSDLDDKHIRSLSVSVSTTVGQCSVASWHRDNC